jgi:hypothetical protein
MPALRWAALLIVSLALSGCCTFGDMCSMAPPTSGPAMAWDGTGQPPDQKIAQASHPRHVFAREIASGELIAIPIVRPKIVQTTWMSQSSHHPPSDATQIVARLIRDLARQLRASES